MFKAPWYLSGEHLQTVVNSLRPVKNLLQSTERQIIFSLDQENSILVKVNEVPLSKKAILFIHGLEGTSESKYILRNAPEFLKDGYSVIRMNMRNCNSTEGLCKTLYNAGMFEDVKKLIASDLFQNYTDIVLMGFSLGANVLGRFCGIEANQIDKRIKRVFLVSPPLDLLATSKKITLPKNRFYNQIFTKSLVAKVRLKSEIFPDIYDGSVLKNVHDLFSFDELVTARHFGFEGAVDYYKTVSCLPCLENSVVPICIIHSEGDPIIDFSAFEELRQKKLKNITIEIVQKAGHVGFYGAYPNKAHSYNTWLHSYVSSLMVNC